MAASNEKRKSHKNITMKEVAQKAGVALSTVSHVINGTASISEETKNRVWEVIRQENYSPNALARGLRSSRTNVIGVVVPDISNEFYSKASSTILRRAAKDQTVTILIDYGYDHDHERKSIEELLERRVDGLIFIGGGNDKELLEWVAAQRIPCVLADCHYKDFCSVEFDNKGSMEKLVRILSEMGYQKIGYISESSNLANLQDRKEGVLSGLQQMGLEVLSDWFLKSDHFKLDKYDMSKSYMSEILKSTKPQDLPEVFITSNDMIAAGVIDALTTAGYEVPADIGVVGYDNISLSQYYKPSITTVFQDSKKLGSESYELLQRVMNDVAENEYIMLECQVVLRDSTRKI